jgi:hypothetical protein
MCDLVKRRCFFAISLGLLINVIKYREYFTIHCGTLVVYRKIYLESSFSNIKCIRGCCNLNLKFLQFYSKCMFLHSSITENILSRVEGLCVTYKTGFGLDDWIYCTLYIHKSGLQAITALSLISTHYIPPLHTH